MLKVLGMVMVMAVVGGCQGFLAQRMVAAPNGNRTPGPVSTEVTAAGREIRIPVGPPEATLAAWVMEPAKGAAARGTILCLHGFLDRHTQLASAGKSLSAAGYRVVLVDLRGHGNSTGARISFGVVDARDLVQVTDYLQQQNLCGKTVGVLGVSYGAATAIQYAGTDPRVAAVVAVAPFATLRKEAPYFGRHLMPVPGLFFSEKDFMTIVDQMGRLAEFDPDACDAVAAIQKSAARVRLFHGAIDMITPCDASRQLAAAAPERTELTIFPAKGHLELCFDVLGQLHGGTREWFDTHLAERAAAGG